MTVEQLQQHLTRLCNEGYGVININNGIPFPNEHSLSSTTPHELGPNWLYVRVEDDGSESVHFCGEQTNGA